MSRLAFLVFATLALHHCRALLHCHVPTPKTFACANLDASAVQLDDASYAPPQDAARYDLKACGVVDLRPTAFKHATAALKVVDLSHNRIAHLDKNVFDFVRNSLLELHLEGNVLLHVSAELFKMPELHHLDLTDNRLDVARLRFGDMHVLRLGGNNNNKAAVKDACLAGASRSDHFLTSSQIGDVRHLNLSANALFFVPSAYFDRCHGTVTVDLSHNRIQSLSKSTFNNSVNLEYLNLRNNLIVDIPEELLAAANRIHFLDMSHNRIGILPKGVFRVCPRAQLYLSHNKINQLPRGVFGECTETLELTLNNNQINFIRSDTFANMSRLNKLDISDNDLRSMPRNVFRGNPTLEKINMDRIGITTMPEEIFSTNAKLISVSLVGNQLTTLADGAFANNLELEYLDLSKNSLIDLRAEVLSSGVSNIVYLDLSGNRLSKLPRFDPNIYHGLVALNAHDNLLERVPDGVISLPDLKHLYLSCNDIAYFPRFGKDQAKRMSNVSVGLNPLKCGCLEELYTCGVPLVKDFFADGKIPTCIVEMRDKNCDDMAVGEFRKTEWYGVARVLNDYCDVLGEILQSYLRPHFARLR